MAPDYSRQKCLLLQIHHMHAKQNASIQGFYLLEFKQVINASVEMNSPLGVALDQMLNVTTPVLMQDIKG